VRQERHEWRSSRITVEQADASSAREFGWGQAVLAA
jgi:hypothetical protein